jgi:DNA-binding NarL/FixJ family response regulator
MPSLNGLDATRQLLQHDPHFKVIVLTITDSDQVIREALDAGARGFVLKSDAARDLVAAVEALQSKRMFFTPRVNDLLLSGFLEKRHAISRNEPPDLPTLTAREREVTQLLAESKSSKEVASLLNLSTKTVETHRKQHHAEAQSTLHARSGRVRHQKQHHPDPDAATQWYAREHGGLRMDSRCRSGSEGRSS